MWKPWFVYFLFFSVFATSSSQNILPGVTFQTISELSFAICVHFAISKKRSHSIVPKRMGFTFMWLRPDAWTVSFLRSLSVAHSGWDNATMINDRNSFGICTAILLTSIAECGNLDVYLIFFSVFAASSSKKRLPNMFQTCTTLIYFSAPLRYSSVLERYISILI